MTQFRPMPMSNSPLDFINQVIIMVKRLKPMFSQIIESQSRMQEGDPPSPYMYIVLLEMLTNDAKHDNPNSSGKIKVPNECFLHILSG